MRKAYWNQRRRLVFLFFSGISSFFCDFTKLLKSLLLQLCCSDKTHENKRTLFCLAGTDWKQNQGAFHRPMPCAKHNMQNVGQKCSLMQFHVSVPDLIGLQRWPLRFPGDFQRWHFFPQDQKHVLLPLFAQHQVWTLRNGKSMLDQKEISCPFSHFARRLFSW